MHDYRVTIAGLNDEQVTFSAEALVTLDTDIEPHWVSVQHWNVANPRLAGRDRHDFHDQTAAANGWTLLPGRRNPSKTGELTIPAEPADWETVLTHATELAEQYRRVEAAWHALIADTPLPVVRVGEIAGFGRHRIYQIQKQHQRTARPTTRHQETT